MRVEKLLYYLDVKLGAESTEKCREAGKRFLGGVKMPTQQS